MRQPRTIQGRMARMLAVPLVVMLGLLSVVVISEVRAYRAAAATSDAVRLTLAVQDLVHELQRERGLTNGLLGGETRYRSDVDTQRQRADLARTSLDALIADGTAPGSAAVRGALDLLDDQGVVRGSVDAGRANRAVTFDYYTNAIDALNTLTIGTNETADGLLRRHLAALQALGDAKEASAKERGFLNGIFAAGSFRPAGATASTAGSDEYARFADMRAAKRAALAQFDRNATPSQRALADAALRSTAATRAAGYEESAIAAADGRPLSIDPRGWWDAMTTLVDDLRGVQQAVGADARTRATDMQRAATTELTALLAIATVALIGLLLMLIASARSITRPLAKLAREADDMATRRLPEAVALIQAASDEQEPPPPVQIPADAGREVRLVTQALNRVQQVAHALATEQAVLRRNTTRSLANLGRRNQNLLRRQLGFISQLEREESDPSALSNLFELDHLATRMRRNAESLLVLVGETSPRRWATPLPAADVIRSAIAEVEDYRRVELRRIDDAFIAGAVATDIAHMIAELMENGLAFSPPDLDVEIYGRWTGTQYLIAIVDQGVGMANDELDRANARLRGEEHFLLGPAKFLGHYVVGQLARELGVAVQLAHSPVTGITARLVLPPELIAAAPESHAPAALPVGASSNAASLPSASTSYGYQEHPTGALPIISGVAAGVTGSSAPMPSTGVSALTAAIEPVGIRADRTRNGLVKRPPRVATAVRHQGAISTTGTAVNGTAASGAAAARDTASERQPDDVRAMLSAFRAGTQRGETRSANPAMTQEQERGPN